MDIAELRTRAEHFITNVDGTVTDALHSFVGWIEGKQAEEAREQEAVAFLQGLGYTVSK